MIFLTINKKRSILTMINQRNPLKDLSSDMGLTTRELQSKLVINEPAHYFEVRDTRGNRYCHCGSEKYAQEICERNWAYDYTYVKIYFPPQETVDVSHTTIPGDPELPPQQILPDTQQEPFNP
jgi:hypothetical protein